MKYLILLAVIAVSAVSGTVYSDCGSEGSGVLLDMEDCDSPPCIFERGRTYSANITFTADHVVSDLTVAVTAFLGGINVPWPGFDKDGCAHLANGQICPVAANTQIVWTYMAEILAEYPAVSTVAKFKLTDDQGHVEVCTEITVVLV